MPFITSRRTVLKLSTAVTATAVGGVLTACGGGDDVSTPMSTSARLSLTATQAVEAIKNGTLTAEDYVSALLDRAEALSSLHAMIALDRPGALAAAKSIDALRRSGGVLPALAGLPLVIKDNINTKSLPTTGGTPSLQNVRPSQNAPSLQKLIDAGAIVLGKANMHELALGITSTNFSSFAGAVKNPYDQTRIPGGSSGGTAAAIAARFSPAGLGSDTSGSIRIPAALCGIAGLRPSVGTGGVQRRYHDENAVVPISHTRDTVGPMARTVADLALLDAVITGRSVPRPVGLKGLRIGVPATFWGTLDAEVAAVMTTARQKLIDAGVVLIDVDMVGLRDLDDKVGVPVALHEINADIPAYLAATGVTGITLADVAAGVASPDVSSFMVPALADVFGSSYADAIGVQRPALQALYANYFSANALDAILFPTTILPAVPIDAVRGSSTVSINGGPPMDEVAAYTRNASPASNAGIPGLSLYAGMTASKLPVGMELDGPVGSDQLLLAIGMSMEAILGLAPAPAL